MEVKINREIREYTESMFFGLSMRQFFFSVIACVVAVVTYILLKPVLGLEVASWVCILCAFPFALLGFLKYNGMPAEKFLIAWIKSELLLPKRLVFGNTNLYSQMLESAKKEEKRMKRRNMFRLRKGKDRIEDIKKRS